MSLRKEETQFLRLSGVGKAEKEPDSTSNHSHDPEFGVEKPTTSKLKGRPKLSPRESIRRPRTSESSVSRPRSGSSRTGAPWDSPESTRPFSESRLFDSQGFPKGK